MTKESRTYEEIQFMQQFFEAGGDKPDFRKKK